MKNSQKRALYESIMKNVAKTVKRALNEQASSDMEELKATVDFIGDMDWSDVMDDLDTMGKDYMAFYNNMLKYGIDLTTFMYNDVDLSEAYLDDEEINPIKLKGLDSEVQEYILNWTEAGISDFDEWDNFIEENPIEEELNCIGSVQYTDHVSFIDTWYIIQMNNGKKCIIMDGRERDSLGLFVEL